MTITILAFFGGGIGPQEMLIFGVIALLLFGKRLPEVARSLGKGVTEFKKGLNGIERELNSTQTRGSYTPPSRPIPDDDRIETSAPRFEPPTQAPTEATPSSAGNADNSSSAEQQD